MDERLSYKTKPAIAWKRAKKKKERKNTKRQSEWKTAGLDFIYTDKSISGGSRLRLFKRRHTDRKKKGTERAERREEGDKETGRERERVMSY